MRKGIKGRRALVVGVAAVLAVALAWGLSAGRGQRLLRRVVRSYYAVVGDTGGPLTVVDRGSWQSVGEGIELHRLVVTRPNNLSDVTLVAVRLDPAQFRFVVRTGPAAGRHVDELARADGAIAAINGGYFDASGQPLGLLITGGETVAGRLASAEGRGVFGVRDGQPFVADAAGLTLDGVSEALQTTPLLVRDGLEVEGFTEPWRIDRRAAVCVDARGRVLFAATDTLLNGLSFSELAHLLARDIDRGGLGCVDAMNLDGGTSAQLWIDGQREASVPGYVGVPVALLAIPLEGA